MPESSDDELKQDTATAVFADYNGLFDSRFGKYNLPVQFRGHVYDTLAQNTHGVPSPEDTIKIMRQFGDLSYNDDFLEHIVKRFSSLVSSKQIRFRTQEEADSYKQFKEQVLYGATRV